MESAFAGASSVIANAFAGLAGAFSVGAMAAMVTSSIDAADGLSKLAQRTGETVENLARLQYAGSLADVSNDALATSLKKLAKNMAEAASGTGEVADAFRAIGVSVVASDGKLRSSGEVLNDVADRFAGYEDSAARSALAQAIFGRSGADLIPLLNAGSQGLKEMGNEASRLGAVISTETAQAAERFNDQMTRVNAALGSIAKQTAAELLPVLNELADSLVDIAKRRCRRQPFVQSALGRLPGDHRRGRECGLCVQVDRHRDRRHGGATRSFGQTRFQGFCEHRRSNARRRREESQGDRRLVGTRPVGGQVCRPDLRRLQQ